MPRSPDAPALTPEQRTKRATIGGLRRRRNPQAEVLARDFHVERAEDFIRQLVAAAPPLNAEQVQRLRDLLPPVTVDGGAP